MLAHLPTDLSGFFWHQISLIFFFTTNTTYSCCLPTVLYHQYMFLPSSTVWFFLSQFVALTNDNVAVGVFLSVFLDFVVLVLPREALLLCDNLNITVFHPIMFFTPDPLDLHFIRERVVNKRLALNRVPLVKKWRMFLKDSYLQRLQQAEKNTRCRTTKPSFMKKN